MTMAAMSGGESNALNALWREGDMIDSKYRIEELLGSGGMGDVYRATNSRIDRPVAIKRLRLTHIADAEVVKRFLREARFANVVQHPNVVDVFDVGSATDGSPFIVQELLVGEDLASYVRRRERLDLDEIRELVVPIVAAVAAAHEAGVIHRDIKPANVFLAQGRRHNAEDTGRRSSSPPSTARGSTTRMGHVPKLLDFGISKLRRPDVGETQAGVVLGTPSYMAPELLTGVEDADERSDVWSLGVMLFELLSGRRPFTAKAPSVYVLVATTNPPALREVAPDVAPEVAWVVDQCLRRDPAARFASAGDLLNALVEALEVVRVRDVADSSSSIELAIDFESHSNVDPSILLDVDVVPPGVKVPVEHATVPPETAAPNLVTSEPPNRMGLASRAPMRARRAPARQDQRLQNLISLAWVVFFSFVVLGILKTLLGWSQTLEPVRAVIDSTPFLARAPVAIVLLALGAHRLRGAFQRWSTGSPAYAIFLSGVAATLGFLALELTRHRW